MVYCKIFLAHEMEVVMGYKCERCYVVYGRAMSMRIKMTRPNMPLNPLLKEWPRLVIYEVTGLQSSSTEGDNFIPMQESGMRELIYNDLVKVFAKQSSTFSLASNCAYIDRYWCGIAARG